MNDIGDYERRISAALDRIRSGLERLSAGGPDAASGAEAEALRQALETERAANAQLTERVRAVKDKQEIQVAALERNVQRLTATVDAQAREMQALRRTNAELAEANRRLTDAQARGVSDPGMLNSAMMTEIVALRAARDADIAEMNEILSELRSKIGEVA